VYLVAEAEDRESAGVSIGGAVGLGRGLAHPTNNDKDPISTKLRVIGCLAPQLSGARVWILNRNYLIPTHRFPPTINEDQAACPIQHKLGGHLNILHAAGRWGNRSAIFTQAI
jgi:hypothetical protein